MSSTAIQSRTQLDLQGNKSERYVTLLICSPSQTLNMQASKTESTWKGKENQMWHEKFIVGGRTAAVCRVFFVETKKKESRIEYSRKNAFELWIPEVGTALPTFLHNKHTLRPHCGPKSNLLEGFSFKLASHPFFLESHKLLYGFLTSDRIYWNLVPAGEKGVGYGALRCRAIKVWKVLPSAEQSLNIFLWAALWWISENMFLLKLICWESVGYPRI